MRVAPGDDAAAARDALAAHLRAHAPWGAQVSVQPGAVAAPFTARTGGRAYRCARSALDEAWGTAGRGRGRGRLHPLRHRLRRPLPGRGDPDHRGGGPRHPGARQPTRACTWPPSSGPAWPRPCCWATWEARPAADVGEQRCVRLRREPGRPGDVGDRVVPAADQQGVDGALLADPGDQARPVGVGQVAVAVQRVGGAEHGPVGRFGPARVVRLPGGHRADLLAGEAGLVPRTPGRARPTRTRRRTARWCAG